MPKAEQSQYTVRSCQGRMQTRAAEDGAKIIDCYFAVFGDIYHIAPGWDETIEPGAFDGLDGQDIRALIDHDTRLVLGRTIAGTLTLEQDDVGLHGVIKINEQDSDAVNLYARVQRGDVTQCSFGFDIDKMDTRTREDGTTLDVLQHVILYEVSVVTFPAYCETSAEARSHRDGVRKSAHLIRWKNKLTEKLKG